MILKEGDLLVWRKRYAHIPYRMDISRPSRNSCGGVFDKHQVVSQCLHGVPLLEFIQIEFLDTEYNRLSVRKGWEETQIIVAFSNPLLERKCWCHFIYISHNGLYHTGEHPRPCTNFSTCSKKGSSLSCCRLSKFLLPFSSRGFRIKSSEDNTSFIWLPWI